jgi:flagellar protein FliJ
MMRKSTRFEPIREIASNTADALSRGVADAERHLAEGERQLLQLQQYRTDYLNQPERSPDSMDTVRLQNLRSFLDRLGDAVRVQTEVVATARADYEAKRLLWSQKRVEAEALAKVVDRFKLDERRAQDKRDQNESDDASMRRLATEHFDIG